MIPVNEQNAAEVAVRVRNGEMPGPARTVAEALARIYADGGRYVQRTGQMQGPFRYSYAKESDFISVLRPLLEAHGVTVRATNYQIITNESFERGPGKLAYRVVVLATFRFLHTSGDSVEAQAIGEGQDNGDKAFNKAMTAAMKYVLRQTFCVETGDDPDDTPSYTQERDSAKPHTSVSTATNNLRRRAELAQQLGQCQSRDQYLAVCKAIAADVKSGTINEDDRAALRPLAAEVAAKYPPAE